MPVAPIHHEHGRCHLPSVVGHLALVVGDRDARPEGVAHPQPFGIVGILKKSDPVHPYARAP